MLSKCAYTILSKHRAPQNALISVPLRTYERMSTEDYLINIRKSMTNTHLQKGKLPYLLEANHGQDAKINLFGVPTVPLEKTMDLFLEAVGLHRPDVVFLQLDPMNYLTRSRFMSHKCALHDVEDYDKKANDDFNFPYPMTWEEAVVNLVVFDMLRANQIHMKLDYTKGVSTYAYPDLQDERTKENLHDKFVQAITDYIVCDQWRGINILQQTLAIIPAELGEKLSSQLLSRSATLKRMILIQCLFNVCDQWSPYYEINQILYKALMGKHRVILGDMPEVLLRQILGNSLSLEDVKDIFKFVLQQISKAKVPLTMQTASQTYFSHIFLMPKDLYMTALLRNVMQAANCSLVYVGTPHYVPIQNYWRPPPNGINYSQATRIPKRIENETDEMLIEKQAILDVLLDTRVWGEKYITNPFPYIEKDITKIPEKDLRNFKQHFYVNLRKYQTFRDKIVWPEAYQLLESPEQAYQRLGDVTMIPKL